VRRKIGVQHEEGRVARKFMRPARAQPSHAPTAIGHHLFPNTMGGTEIPPEPGVCPALMRSKSASNTRGRQFRSEIHAQSARAQLRMCPLRLGVIYFQTRWRQATAIPPARRVAPAHVRTVHTNARKEGSLENSCGSARAQPPHTRPLRLGRHLFPNTTALALVCSKSASNKRKEGRSKIHAARSAHSRTRPMDWGIIYCQTRWRQRYTEIPLVRRVGASLHRAQQIGVQHEGRVARKFMWPGACSARTRHAIGASFISKTRWRQRYTEISPARCMPCAHA
jgi:hypothetical protein